MDVIARVRRFAYAHPRVFVAEAPGATAARLQVERLTRRHGWPIAESPPDTDLLVLCGRFGPSSAPVVARLQAMLGAPAGTLLVADGDDDGVDDGDAAADDTGGVDGHAGDDDDGVDDGDDHIMVDLRVSTAHVEAGLEAARQRLWQRPEPTRMPLEEQREQVHDPETGDHEAHDHDEHADHEGDHDMEPGGLPMASRAEDRDGLSLDVLQVPLGPVLPAWPAGLTLQLTLQGDVIQDLRIDPRGLASKGSVRSFWNGPWRRAQAGEGVRLAEAERRRAAAHLDSLTRLLRVAGDGGGALIAARLRDEALSGEAAELLRPLAGLERRLTRGRLLDRITRGVGRIGLQSAIDIGLSGPALRASGGSERQERAVGARSEAAVALGEGDARSRWRQWFAEARLALQRAAEGGSYRLPPQGLEGPRGLLGQDRAPSQALLRALHATLLGQELAVARLIVASFDPDIAELHEAGER